MEAYSFCKTAHRGAGFPHFRRVSYVGEDGKGEPREDNETSLGVVACTGSDGHAPGLGWGEDILIQCSARGPKAKNVSL